MDNTLSDTILYYYTREGRTESGSMNEWRTRVLQQDECATMGGTWQTLVGGKKVECAEPETIQEARFLVTRPNELKKLPEKINFDWGPQRGWVPRGS
jgi:hypothetical protein